MRWIWPGRFIDPMSGEAFAVYWGFFLGETPVQNASMPTGSRTGAEVNGMPWAMCNAFCERHNEQSSPLSVRMPREAEWRYARWAGGARPKPRPGQPNPWGLRDLGARLEWCHDQRVIRRQRVHLARNDGRSHWADPEEYLPGVQFRLATAPQA